MTNEVGPPVPEPAKTVTGRRSFSETEKQRLVEEASQPGMTLSQVARRYGIDRRVLFRWKEVLRPKKAKAETAPAVFAPVQIMDTVPELETLPSAPAIEIELAGGRRVRFERNADPETVRRLLALLEETTP